MKNISLHFVYMKYFKSIYFFIQHTYIINEIIEFILNNKISENVTFRLKNGVNTLDNGPINASVRATIDSCNTKALKKFTDNKVSENTLYSKLFKQNNCKLTNDIWGFKPEFHYDSAFRHDFEDFVLRFAGRNLDWTDSYKLLGTYFDSNLTFRKQRENVNTKFKNNLWKLRKFGHKYSGATRKTLSLLYLGSILPILMYSTPLWFINENCVFYKKIEATHAFASKIVTGNYKNSSNLASLIDLNWNTVKFINIKIALTFVHKVMNLEKHHRIVDQWCLLNNSDDRQSSEFWKNTLRELDFLCIFHDISTHEFASTSKTYAKKLIKTFIQNLMQILWDNYKNAAFYKTIKPVVGGIIYGFLVTGAVHHYCLKYGPIIIF